MRLSYLFSPRKGLIDRAIVTVLWLRHPDCDVFGHSPIVVHAGLEPSFVT